MASDEGYIKFKAQWRKAGAPEIADISDLNDCRQACFDKQWIGAYLDGIGYGNISCRIGQSKKFWITGSATGNIEVLKSTHFSKVTEVDVANNELWCEGPIIASSESMSHAVIYGKLDWVKVVIHIHHLAAWRKLLHKVPTTDATAAYGSPEMAESIISLLQETDLPRQKLFVMEGHQEGLFSFGRTFEEAFGVLLARV